VARNSCGPTTYDVSSVSTSALNWNSLRPLDGSQQKAFEELCVQLAGGEPMPTGSKFVRKGTPDAGVECYWILPSGGVLGWQAKFFRESLGASQWQQIDESVEKALSKHPDLQQYTICLPIDRADPRETTKQFLMDHWNTHEQKWRARAKQLGLAIEFVYWGQSEILARLALEQHRGRHYFWFNKELFSREWFSNKLEIAIANAGRRYHPVLNVKLSISSCFGGLGWTPDFLLEIERTKGELRRRLDRATDARDGFCPSETSRLGELDHIDAAKPALPLKALAERVSDAFKAAAPLDACLRELEGLERAAEQERKKANSGISSSERVMSARHYLYRLERTLAEIAEFTKSSEALLANTPVLLLFGNAGVGKTHLFCDAAKGHESNDQPTLLLLGEQFSSDEPWSQILKILGLTCPVDDFLGALNAAGELRQCRALIFIDAVNEGEGISVWPKHLAGMLVQLRKYPWIGIALSVRETYLDAIIPRTIGDDMVRVRHFGFSGSESLAVTSFFAHYKIATPGIPLLQPEFSNPLFLMLFCEGIATRGMSHVPDGLEGLTAVFAFFLDSINEKLSKPEHLDFDPKSRLVHQAVEIIASQMASSERQWLPRGDVQTLLQTIHSATGWKMSLLHHLLGEGILSQDLFGRGTETVEGIRFSYERFTDHQIAMLYLKRFLDAGNPASSFASEMPLGMLLKDESTSWRNGGIIAAFAIQIPEQTGKELIELAPHCVRFRPVTNAMIESFMWRKNTAYSPATLDYINRHLFPYRDTGDEMLRTLIAVSTQPGHPYNAELLHRNLMRRTMPNRDAWWSTFIHHEYWEEQSPVKRILDWAEVEQVPKTITDRALFLIGTTIGWFLTSSNRFLRDRATKALVILFTDRIPILCEVLTQFRSVDDMYVLERFLASAYGCSMRSSNPDHLKVLGTWCFDHIFKDEPPPHILLRDYARGIIERSLGLGAELPIDRRKIQPPYGAKWPKNIPSKEKLAHFGKWELNGPKVHHAQFSIYSSVLGGGDFDRYIIGTNSGAFEWKDIRLGRPRPPSPKEIRKRFVESLSSSQRTEWDRLEKVKQQGILARFALMGRSEKDAEKAAEQHQRHVEKARESLVHCLDAERQRTYLQEILPLEEAAARTEHRFDLGLIQRFVLNRVFQLGWTAERFGEFDASMSDHGRDSHKAERIGKKYQWLAYHEALARVADNFVFQQWWSEKEKPYTGAWQVSGLRDIDPSITIKKTFRSGYRSAGPSWWAPMLNPDWRSNPSDRGWLRESKDLPRLSEALHPSDPIDGSSWLTLQGYYRWEEPTPPDREWSELPHREIWCHLRSYIVRKQDFEEVFAWAKRQNFMGRWMPESSDTYNLFAGELYWSSAFRDQWEWALGSKAWTQGDMGEQQKLPKPVIVTAQESMWEASGYDCSLEEGVRTHVPCPWLAERLGLHWTGREGVFKGANGKIIAQDPSIFARGAPALLIRPAILKKLLDEVDCEMFWTVLGEKQILGGSMSPYPARNELSGALAIRNRKLEGLITSRFRDFERERRR
jgi:hypothetical protein